ncbi:HAD-IIIC family phosphatase [Agrobacterium rhizogenes]|nr:HAD-IIIC family phosphatase [Rhizobium rhizogenes]NTH53724.1 HAD-IIIC family phosphatase [Rhizobium rhizogenes]NTH73308.1 HAD-IIIC family phosphatase [Rhizobium rhizogenes]
MGEFATTLAALTEEPSCHDSSALSTAEIVDAITQVLESNCNVIEVHSSISALTGRKYRPSKWTFLRAVRQLVRNGKTLLFPAFTFSYAAGNEFHIKNSRSETGILAEWVLELPEAHRTPNPIFSFVVIGPKTQLFLDADHRDAYGPKSVLAVLEEQDGGALMLGASWDYLSFLHKLEQEMAVPYREFKIFHQPAELGAGLVDPEMRVYVRRRDIRTELDFAAAGRAAEEEGLVRSSRLGEGQVKFVRICDVAEIGRRKIKENPCFLLKESHRVSFDIENISLREQQPPFRVAVLSAENPDYLLEELRKYLPAVAPSRKFEFYSNDFGSLYQDLTLEVSSLRTFDPDFTIVADTFESICTISGRHAIDLEDYVNRLERWVAAVCSWLHAGRGKVAVLKPIWASSPVLGDQENTASNGFEQSAADMNLRLYNEFQQNQGILIDTSSLAGESATPLRDPRTWYLARTPYSIEFAKVLAKRFAGLILDRCGLSTRLIVVDLDNTLWGGIAGDDGIESVALGGDFPGNAYQDFQLMLRSLSQRGIGLAIASKNDPQLAFEIIDNHPHMALRTKDFVDHEIHWNQKADSISRITKRLNLGLANVLFLDDNPVEREAVKRAFPQVIVPDIGHDPALYCDIVRQIPQLNAALITNNDRKRADSFKQLKAVSDARERSTDHFSFIRDLDVHVLFSRLSPGNIARAEQLMAKTNQFNTTVKRYSSTDLKRINDQGSAVIVIDVADKFNSKEIMGVIILRDYFILDSVVLSCRALGKGVEQNIFQAISKHIFERTKEFARVDFHRTPRNQVAGDVLKELKFSEHEDGWVATPDSLEVQVPIVRISGIEEQFK